MTKLDYLGPLYEPNGTGREYRESPEDIARHLRQAELDDARPTDRTGVPLTGIAVSGGGIRSAIFALGVFQALEEKGKLAVDYLSTVSGGGYLGGSLTFRANPHGSANGNARHESWEFPYPSGSATDPKDFNHADQLLAHLRGRGEYLTPTSRINAFSLAGAVLRAIAINLLVWIPILLLLVAAAQRLPSRLPDLLYLPVLGGLAPLSVPLALAFAFGVVGLVRHVIRNRRLGDRAARPHKPWQRRLRTTTWFVFLLLVWSVLATLATGVEPMFTADLPPDGMSVWLEKDRLAVAMLYVAGIAFVGIGLAIVLLSGLAFVLGTAKGRFYRASRRVDATVYGAGLKLACFLAILATVPWAASQIAVGGGAALTAVGLVGSLVQAFANKADGGALPLAFLAPVLAGAFLYGLFVLAYASAAMMDASVTDLVVWGALASVVIGYFANKNLTSVGRYYRDRLMEAFMPNTSGEASAPATEADDFKLKDARNPYAPFHIINTHATLTDSRIDRVRQRGGDNFVLTPAYCGSNTTGWLPTDQFMDGDMTLATAVATSAAAVNPRGFIGGRGLTHARTVAFLMALLNIRLGTWVPNPRDEGRGARQMNHFWSAWYELNPGGGYREQKTLIELSDGGHFENLGLYELIRRRLETIVVIDGATDPDFNFGDLHRAIARCKEDFGAEIRFDVDDLQRLVPNRDGTTERYPAGTTYAERAWIKGSVRYSGDGDETGEIYYLKSTLVRGLPLEVLGYKNDNPDFPDQTIVDQFFTEDQFDAYRLLGNHLGRALAATLPPSATT